MPTRNMNKKDYKTPLKVKKTLSYKERKKLAMLKEI